jgi:[ribosomal protein S5]-alanine N-acetyltransferase
MPTEPAIAIVLIRADEHVLRASLEGRSALAQATGREVAADWPPLHWDVVAVEWAIAHMRDAPSEAMWLPRLACLPSGTIVGTGGFKGPPDSQGAVEIGYSVVQSQWRRGIGTGIAAQLVGEARSDDRVALVRAHTLHGDPASSGVLRRNGFRLVGTLHDPHDGEVDRFELALRGLRHE